MEEKLDIKKEYEKNEKDALIDAIALHLDTRDKRYMFIKCMFTRNDGIDISRIQLEENSFTAAFNIVEYFAKHKMDGSLMACINTIFDLELMLSLGGDES